MGGNVFKGKTESIKLENIEPTIEKFFEELKEVFPKKADIFNKGHFKYVGSVGKKDVSGDIDLAIDIKSLISETEPTKEDIMKYGIDPEEVESYYVRYKKRARTATEASLKMRALLTGIVHKINENADNIYSHEKKISATGIFNLFPQYNVKGEKQEIGVQIDFMIGDLELLEFSYYSEEYKSNVKGLHRTQLMLSIFNYYGYSFAHAKGLSKDGIVVAVKPKEIIEVLDDIFVSDITKETVNNYFSLVKVLDELDFDTRDSILNIYFRILSKTRADIPEDLQVDYRRLTKIYEYQTKFLPESSLLLR